MQNEDVDYYLIEAKKGERITAEIEAIRHDFGTIVLRSLCGDSGHGPLRAGRSDDSSLLKQDSTVSAIAPADGTYVVQVRDSSYAGSDTRPYRLHVGRFPRPVTVPARRPPRRNAGSPLAG